MGIETAYQAGLFSVLDAAKVSLGVTAIYDTAPQADAVTGAAAFPYITMGLIFPTNWDTDLNIRFQVTSRLHVWSRSSAMGECKTIQGEMFDLLHRNRFAIAGFKHVDIMRQDTSCEPSQDKRIHGICEYLSLVSKTS